MKLLHTADWHLGRYLHGQSLLEDQEHVLGQLISLAQQEQVDIVLIAAELHDLQLLAALKAGVDGLVEFGAGPQAVLDALALVLRGGQAIAPELQTRALHATRSSDLLRDLAALSPRGRMLLEAVVAGRTTAEIAAQLGCGIGGARVALHRLYTQLGVRSRTALTRLIGENKVRL